MIDSSGTRTSVLPYRRANPQLEVFMAITVPRVQAIAELLGVELNVTLHLLETIPFGSARRFGFSASTSRSS